MGDQPQRVLRLQLAVVRHPHQPGPENRGTALQPGADGVGPGHDGGLLRRRGLVQGRKRRGQGLLQPLCHGLLRPALRHVHGGRGAPAVPALPPAGPGVRQGLSLLVCRGRRLHRLRPVHDLPVRPGGLFCHLPAGRGGCAAPGGGEGDSHPAPGLVAEPAHLRQRRHPHHRLRLPQPPDVRELQRPRLPLLGPEGLRLPGPAG